MLPATKVVPPLMEKFKVPVPPDPLMVMEPVDDPKHKGAVVAEVNVRAGGAVTVMVDGAELQPCVSRAKTTYAPAARLPTGFVAE